MTTINERKLNAISNLIANFFTTLITLAADETEQPETVKAKGYIVTTKKTKNNGALNKGYTYVIDITDGKNTASFINNGETSININNLIRCENKYGSRFLFDKEDKKLHQLRGFGKSTGMKEQKENLMAFVKSCLNSPISFSDGTFTYAV